jgi:hypothetical protein
MQHFKLMLKTSGCKRGTHGSDKDENESKNEKIYFPDCRQVNDAVKRWENDCFHDPGYNEQLKDLLIHHLCRLHPARP